MNERANRELYPKDLYEEKEDAKAIIDCELVVMYNKQ
jgi:hypothetical protein